MLLTDEEILRAIWQSEYRNIEWQKFKKVGIKKYERVIAQAQLDDDKREVRELFEKIEITGFNRDSRGLFISWQEYQALKKETLGEEDAITD